MKKPFILILLIIMCSCASENQEVQIDPEVYWGDNPWPEIRKQRINQLLPIALQEAEVDAFDGFHCWERADGTEKTISVEEMAVITADGAYNLTPPQEYLILISMK